MSAKQPWLDEPDELQFVDEATGLECLILRAHSLIHLCGYVRVPEGHPLHGLSYDNAHFEVHGGITFAGDLDPRPGFWFGFDCAHLNDLVPGMRRRESTDTYRTIDYVRAQCSSLARQIKNAAEAT